MISTIFYIVRMTLYSTVSGLNGYKWCHVYRFCRDCHFLAVLVLEFRSGCTRSSAGMKIFGGESTVMRCGLHSLAVEPSSQW